MGVLFFKGIYYKASLEACMNCKFILILPISAMFFACSESSSPSSSGPVISSAVVEVSSSSSVTDIPSVFLPAGANIAYPDNMYALWKSKYYVTMADEIAAGSTDSPLSYFSGTNPARIRWYGTALGTTSCTISGLNYSSPAIWNSYKMGCTVSEGIGYGMLITQFYDDMDAFDALWVYNKGFRQANYYENYPVALMPWGVRGFADIATSSSFSAALDADFDIVTALILAYYKYASVDVTRANAYLADALNIGNAILKYGVNTTNWFVYPGDESMWTMAGKSGYGIHNLSYFSPVALKLLAMVDAANATSWNSILTAGYAYMKAVQANGAGLFPDWSNESYEPALAKSGDENTYFLFNDEAERIPWRIAWDYYWFQSADAAQVLNKMADFILTKTAGSVDAIPAYAYVFKDGSVSTKDASSIEHKGSYCLMGFAGATDWLNNCAASFNASPMTTTYTNYYPDHLQFLFSQLMNGRFVRPF